MGTDRPSGQADERKIIEVIEALDDENQRLKMQVVILKRMAEQARFLMARSNNEALVRSWFSDYKGAMQ
jgi:hypothetical protein